MPFPKTEDELAKAGYKYEGTAKCTGPTCKADIAWYRSPNGRRIPLDEGTLVPHFASCPDVERFRRSK